MTKTLTTGTMARERAEMILRREWKRPKRRMTRRARRTRTKPVGSLVTTMERRDMMTMKESSHDLPPPPRALPPTDTRTSVAGLLRG